MAEAALKRIDADLKKQSESLHTNNLSDNDKFIMSMFDSCLFDVRIKHPTSECLLYCENAQIIKKNCLTLASGKPKCGKGFNIAYMVAGVLGAKDLHVESRKEEPTNKILIFDTEQEGDDIEHFNMRINAMLKRNIRTFDERFKLYPLRELSAQYPDYTKFFFSLDYIEKKIMLENPDLVIIDNIGDFIDEINDSQEGKDKAQKLLDIAKRYNCNITVVLHTNIGGNPDSEVDIKARGSIGTYLTQKCSTHINMDRQKGDTDLVTVKFPHTRGKAPLTFKLHITEEKFTDPCDGTEITLAIPYYQEGQTQTAAPTKVENLRNFFIEFLAGGKRVNQTELLAAIKGKVAGVNSPNTLKKYVTENCNDIMQIESSQGRPTIYSLKEENDLFNNDEHRQN